MSIKVKITRKPKPKPKKKPKKARKKSTKLKNKMKARSHSARGKRNRIKGKEYERAIANDLKAIFGDCVARAHGQSRNTGEAPDIKGVPGFWPEAKHHGVVNVRAAIKQAYEERLAEAAPLGARDKWPVAFCKDDRKRELVIMYKEDFLELLEEWWDRNRRPYPEIEGLGCTSELGSA